MLGNEKRQFAGVIRVEKRADKGPLIRGHAAVFNRLSENLGGFREIIAPGAFDDVLEDDVRALIGHNDVLILGRSTAGTLRIGVDAEGLTYEIDPPDTTYARDLLVSMERGDVRESSFGFRVARGGEVWDEDEDGLLVRTITKFARLYDVSPVTFPAYPDTDVAKRSLEEFRKTKVAPTGQHLVQTQRRARRLALMKVSGVVGAG